MRFSKALLVFLPVLILTAAYTTVGRESNSPEDSVKYIEVCTNGIVYLPPGTKYVTCHGKVMRVMYIAPLMAQIESVPDCNCPKCCGGWCGITVACESAPELSSGETDCDGCGTSASAGSGLCTAYLACD